MSAQRSGRVVHRSPGRLRIHAPWLGAAGDADRQRIATIRGVRDVRLSPHTGNVLIEFDQALVDEPGLLALLAEAPALSADEPLSTDEPATHRPTREPRLTDLDAQVPADDGWLCAERSETFDAPAADCIAVLLEFERYPEWQTYVTSVSVHERDRRGRGVRVRTRATITERELEFTTSYRFPSPNRIAWEQDDGELAAVRGSWAFRSAGGGRSRATCRLEVKPGWRLSVLLRGSLYERIREVVLDHLMNELRARVDGSGP